MPQPARFENTAAHDYCGQPPCSPGDCVRVNKKTYRVQRLEPLYYVEDETAIPIGVNQLVVTNLTPPKNFLYAVRKWGFDASANVTQRLDLPAGAPRNNVAAAEQFLTQLHAGTYWPFDFPFVMENGVNLQKHLNNATGAAVARCSTWFYGWKLQVIERDPQPGERVIDLWDPRPPE